MLDMLSLMQALSAVLEQGMQTLLSCLQAAQQRAVREAIRFLSSMFISNERAHAKPAVHAKGLTSSCKGRLFRGACMAFARWYMCIALDPEVHSSPGLG